MVENRKIGITFMTEITSKGELILCDEGLKLYNDYCRVLDDESIEAFGTVFVNAWRDYNDHFATCEDCRYTG